MVLQVHQRGGVAFLSSKEVLIDAQHLRTVPTREFPDALFDKRLIPTLDSGSAQLVCQ
jgi:hypothetical protein